MIHISKHLPLAEDSVLNRSHDTFYLNVCDVAVLTTSAEAAAVVQLNAGVASVLGAKNVIHGSFRLRTSFDIAVRMLEFPAKGAYAKAFQLMDQTEGPLFARHFLLLGEGMVIGALVLSARQPAAQENAADVAVQRKLADIAQARLHRDLALQRQIQSQFALLEATRTR